MVARSRRKSAFTLIELMVSVVILAMVLVALYSFVNRTVSALNNVTRWAKQGREGPTILAMIERDLGSVYVDPLMKEVFSATSFNDETEVRFVTSRNSTLFLNGVQSDLTEVGYKLEANDEDGSQKLYTLFRREEFLMDEEPLNGGLWIPVAHNIVELSMEFYALPEDTDGEELVLPEMTFSQDMVMDEADINEWNPEDRFLPYLVRIVLRVDLREGVDREKEESEPEGIQTFVSMVRLPPFPRELEELEEQTFSLSLNSTGGSGSGSGGSGSGGSGSGGSGSGGSGSGGSGSGGSGGGSSGGGSGGGGSGDDDR